MFHGLLMPVLPGVKFPLLELIIFISPVIKLSLESETLSRKII